MERNPFLDFLRFFSAELVLAGHLSVALGIPLIFLAQLGVYFFFLLSGFLICKTVFEMNEKSLGFKAYFLSRFCRIYSGFVPALAFIFLVSNQGYLSLDVLFANLLMLQGLPLNLALFGGLGFNLPREIPVFLGVTPLWTLSVEWWLYLFFGWIFLKKGRGPLFFGGAALFFIVPFLFLSFSSSAVVLAWFGGAVAFWLYKKIDLKRFLWWFIAFSIVKILLDLMLKLDLYSDPALVFFLAGVFFSSVQAFERVQFGKWGGLAVSEGAGFSYILYLIHYPLIPVLLLGIAAWQPVQALAVFASINAIAWCLALFTERQNKRLLKFLRGFAGA